MVQSSTVIIDTIKKYWNRFRLGIEFILVLGLGLSIIWGSSTQLDMICVKPIMEYYSPDHMWYFPFFGDWFSVGWKTWDAYVRMFWGIGIGALILTFGMFYLGYRFGKD